jgi:hypothetical protein
MSSTTNVPLSNLKMNNNNNNNSRKSLFGFGNNNTMRNNKNDEISMVSIFIIIIVLIFIGAAAYWLYNKYWTAAGFLKVNEVEIIKDVKDATAKSTIASGLIPTSQYSNEYSVSFWINISNYDYNYGKEKIIMRRGTAGSGNPEILLGAKNNDLIVRVKLQGAPANNAAVCGTSAAAAGKSAFQDIPVILNTPQCGGPVITKDEPYYTYDRFEPSGKIPLLDCNHVSSSTVGSNSIDYPTISYLNPSNLQGDYFSLISGNQIKHTVEGFAAEDDAINAVVKVITDVCDIASLLESQTIANNSVEQLTAFFDMMLDKLDKAATDAKNAEELATSFSASVDSLPNPQMNAELLKKVETLAMDFTMLSQYNDVQINTTTLKTVVNSKLDSIKCPLKMEGTTDIDNTVSFTKNMIKLMRRSLYTYITNMGNSIRQKGLIEADDSQGAGACSGNEFMGECTAKMVPLQKWVNVIVSVYNQVVDIYVDGQLTSSCVLRAFPAVSTEMMEVTPDGGFAGQISRVSFSNAAMTVGDARRIYNNGPIVEEGILESIPTWAWYIIVVLVAIAVLYSVLA